MSNNFLKGSEWRKWDLHIHTPASVLNNGFGTDWDTYVRNLFKILIDKNISVVGITDYFTVDGYKKIKEEYLGNEEKLRKLFSADEIEKIKKILIIPNIEFRSNIFVGEDHRSINFHVLFSENVPVKDIEEKFLHEVDFVFQGDPQQPDKKRKLKESNLIELGIRLKNEQVEFKESGNTDLFIGMMNAVIDHTQISDILFSKESIFGSKYVFVVVADEDLSDIDWKSMDHLTRKVLIQKSDLLFSSNSKTRSWAIGAREGTEKFTGEFRTLKPCIHGSDAHEFKFIGHPCGKRGDNTHNCDLNPEFCDLRYCWIKADPTFEGLKQVLYEPEDRIAIQRHDPTPLKSSQSIAEFYIKGASLDPELKFKETRIPFNNGLIAVTGGKGGGKTAFVDILANMYENRAFCDDKNSFVRRISESKKPKELETSIKLQNNLEHAKEVRANSFIEGASIVYVAQGELEKHVEDPAHLETYINNLIFDSNEIKDSQLLFDYENINDEVSEINEKIGITNKTIFTLENETDPKIEEDLKKESKNLETDTKDTKTKIEELSKSLSQEKIKEAEEKQRQLTSLRDKKTQLTELADAVRIAVRFNREDINIFNKEITRVNVLSEKLNFSNRFKTIEYLDGENLDTFLTTVKENLRKTIGDIEKFQKELEEKEKGIKEHSKLLDKKKEIEKTIHQIKEKLEIITQKKSILLDEVNERTKLFSDLLNKRIEQRDKYIAIIQAFSVNKNDILNDLEFTAELIFDRDRFVKTMSELVDLRKIKISTFNDTDSDIAFFTEIMLDLIIDPSIKKVADIVATSIPKLLVKIIPNQKKAETISRLTIYDSIFADYLGVMPSVKYKKVKLSKLSLGQKATVLMKIYLGQGENPIVIDSHDDHLDNEFIMDELVKALRQAKQYRQVIIVSNNGNVVVNSDAEQVIIACRDDQGEISYISGSLENPDLRPKLLKVLEGGEEAFSKRQKKYRLSS